MLQDGDLGIAPVGDLGRPASSVSAFSDSFLKTRGRVDAAQRNVVPAGKPTTNLGALPGKSELLGMAELRRRSKEHEKAGK